MIFRQLFDTVSSTYTYLLASGTGREAVLIDPVKDQLQQCLTLIADLDLKLRHTTDLPMNSIIATSLLVVALVSTFAVASSALTGHLDFAIAWPFAVGALIGMLAGRAIAPKIAGPKLQQGFAALAALVAVGLIVKTLLVHP